MSQRIIELREQKNVIVTEARALIETVSDNMKQEERSATDTKFDTMMADADALTEQISRLERIEEAERSVNQAIERRAGREDSSNDEAEHNSNLEERAFIEFMKFGVAGVSDENRSAFSALQNVDPTALRAQSSVNGALGGVLVPDTFIKKLEAAKKAYGGLRPIATVIKTENGNPLTFPTVDDTDQKADILEENTAGEDKDVTFGDAQLGAYMYHSGMVKVPIQLLQDNAFNLDDILPPLLTERIARKENAHYASGTGVGQPKGFLNGLPTIESSAADVFTWEDLVELEHSVDPSNRLNGAYAISDDALKSIRKMKDSDRRPIWLESTRAGQPSTILGKPYAIVQEMPGVSADNIPIAFGRFKAYHIRDAGAPIMQRLVERYAELMQVGLHVGERHSGFLLNAGDNPIKGLSIAGAKP